MFGIERDRAYKSQMYLNQLEDVTNKIKITLYSVAAIIKAKSKESNELGAAAEYHKSLSQALEQARGHIARLPKPNDRPHGTPLREWNSTTYTYETRTRLYALRHVAEMLEKAVKEEGVDPQQKGQIQRILNYWSAQQQ
jgi:hypothetical protein